jgi:hypothetical protein
MSALFLTLSLLAAPLAHAADDATVAAASEEKKNPWDRVGFGFGGVPAINYNTDNGFGYGILGSIYRYDGGTQPYKWSSTVLIYLTTKGIHEHRLDWDGLKIGGSPLRLTTRAAFSVTRTSNYCGADPGEFCAISDAELAADAADLEGSAREEFVKNYHRVRMMNPNGFINARYALSPMPHRLELMASWRGGYFMDGDLGSEAPFPGSLYERDYGTNEGFLSVLQAGVMLDNRDNEPAPVDGYWIEASVRGAAPAFGSTWSYFGYNTTLRGYKSLVKSDKLVMTGRFVADGIVGDVPYFELSTAGGSVPYWFFGGQRAGRGIRIQGVVGKVRVVAQPELRWTWASFKAFKKVDVDIGNVFFSDVGWFARDWDAMDENILAVTEGAGFRFAFGKNFIIRADAGFSALEDYAPKIYIDVGNLW